MKVLLTGSSGKLGQSIIEGKPHNVTLIETNKQNLDLRDPDTCKEAVKKNNPDWIINCGAYTNVDKAENNKQLAFTINASAPKAFAEALLETGGKILQISTDFVFNGNQETPYLTYQKRSPINIYGASKAKGEEEIENILKGNDQSIILRTSWLMSSIADNFTTTMVKLNRQKKEIGVVADQIGCPTSTYTLSKACWKVIEKYPLILNSKKERILHWCDNGKASWYEVARYIAEMSEKINLINKASKIKPLKTSEYETLAQRPKYSLLDCTSTRKILDLHPPDWKESLLKILLLIKKNEEDIF